MAMMVVERLPMMTLVMIVYHWRIEYELFDLLLHVHYHILSFECSTLCLLVHLDSWMTLGHMKLQPYLNWFRKVVQLLPVMRMVKRMKLLLVCTHLDMVLLLVLLLLLLLLPVNWLLDSFPRCSWMRVMERKMLMKMMKLKLSTMLMFY